MFCRKCGANIGDAHKCPYCGIEQAGVENNSNNEYTGYVYGGEPQVSKKSRLVAGLLQLFVGYFGIGRFYLGFVGLGILQIVVSLVTCGIGGAIWGFIDGILILSGTVKFDSQGKWLTD